MAEIHRVLEGNVLEAKETFLDTFDEPVVPSQDTSGPVVRLYDKEKDIIIETYAIPDPAGQPGDWVANVSVPDLGISESLELPLVWDMLSDEGDRYRTKQVIIVEPAHESRLSDIVAIVGQDARFEFILPFVPLGGDLLKFGVFTNNQPMYKDSYLTQDSTQVSMDTYLDKTIVTLPNMFRQAKLEPSALMVRVIRKGSLTPETLNYKIWPITPQVMIAASMVEDFINKARLENVIPELEYTTPDLVQYLARGLSLFNMVGGQITAFDGTNMQGTILDCWVICSCYYALGAQLQAEGALAFDFSGQSVSLNVDRTPQIEGALGRIEGQLDSVVKPAKKLLARYGINSGSGDQGGGAMNGAPAIGRLSITNSPTSRFGSRGRGRFLPGAI